MRYVNCIVKIPGHNPVAVISDKDSRDFHYKNPQFVELDEIELTNKKEQKESKNFGIFGGATGMAIGVKRVPSAVKKSLNEFKDLPGKMKLPGIITGAVLCTGVLTGAGVLLGTLIGKTAEKLTNKPQNPVADNKLKLSAEQIGKPLNFSTEEILKLCADEPALVDCDFGPEEYNDTSETDDEQPDCIDVEPVEVKDSENQ